jgi:hypothetical protein
MSLEQAAPKRMQELVGTEDLDWDAVYADQAPRVYNYFRFRLQTYPDAQFVNYVLPVKNMPAAHLVRILRPLLPQVAQLARVSVRTPC